MICLRLTVLVNTWWAYVMPLVGAYIADEHWGRFPTIMTSLAVALVGHVILVVSALPSVIVHPGGAIACFTVGLVIMAVGSGGFKYVEICFRLSRYG